MKNLRSVLHIITNLGTGGAERMLVKLLHGSQCSGFKHHLMVLGSDCTLAQDLPGHVASVTSMGMPLGRLPGFGHMRRFFSCVHRIGPDIIHGWMYHGNAAALVATAALRPRPPVAWSIRQSLGEIASEKSSTKLVIRLGALTGRRAAVIVYNSSLSARHHEAFGYSAERTLLIPNGFDTLAYHPDRSAGRRVRIALGLSSKSAVIGHVARWHPVKDHFTFLAALHELKRRNVDFRAVLVGQGVDETNSALTGRIAAMGLEEKIILLGESLDMAPLMASFDVLCLSSLSEAFPNVIGEAMASAVPVVSTSVGDCAHIIGDAGRVVPPRNPLALALALQDIISLDSDARCAIGERGRERIVGEFSIQRIVGQYTSLYSDLMRKHRPAFTAGDRLES